MVTELQKVRTQVRRELFKEVSGYYPQDRTRPKFNDDEYEKICSYVHDNYFRKKREMFPELCDTETKKKKTKFAKFMSYRMRWHWYWKKRRAKNVN